MKNIFNDYFDFRKINPDKFFSNDYLKEKSFYKYYNFDDKHSLENLKNRILYCSCAADFNDPYDSYPYIFDHQALESVNRRARRNSKGYENIDKQCDRLLKEARNEIYICCMSSLFDSILMWSHYAKNHTGFCVEYNLHSSLSKYDTILSPVIYTEKRPYIPFCREDYKKNKQFKLEYNRQVYGSFMYKAKEWEYESEYRIILPKELYPNHIIEKVRIKSIYVGANASKENINAIHLIVNHLNKIHANEKNFKIRLFKMKLAKKEYKLLYEEII